MRRAHQPSVAVNHATPIHLSRTTHNQSNISHKSVSSAAIRSLSSLPAGDFHPKFERHHPSINKKGQPGKLPHDQKALLPNTASKELITAEEFINSVPAVGGDDPAAYQLSYRHVPSPAMANIDSSLYQFIDDKSWLMARRKDTKLPPGLPQEAVQDIRKFQENLTVPMHIDTIAALALPRHLGGFGFQHLTYIQGKLLPIIASGIDVLLRAPSASGKTLSYVIPLIERLIYMRHQPNSKEIPVIILVPTKELALQTASVIEHVLGLHKRTNTRNYGVISLIGGTSSSRVEQEPLQRTDVGFLVATTQRLIDHIDNTPGFKERLKGTRMVVLDEVDYLLAQTGGLDIGKILQNTNKHRQTVMVSATLTPAVRKVATYALRKGACVVDVVKDSIVSIGQKEENKKAKLSELNDIPPEGYDGDEGDGTKVPSRHSPIKDNVMGYFVDQDGNKVDNIDGFDQVTKAQKHILKQTETNLGHGMANPSSSQHAYQEALASKPPMDDAQSKLLKTFASIETKTVSGDDGNRQDRQEPAISTRRQRGLTLGSESEGTPSCTDDEHQNGSDTNGANHSQDESDLHHVHGKTQHTDIIKAREMLDITHVGSVDELMEQNKDIVDDLALYSDTDTESELVLFNEVNRNVQHFVQACHPSESLTIITRLFDDIGGRFLFAKQQVDAQNELTRKSPTFTSETPLLEYPRPPKILVFCETARYAQFLALLYRRALQTHEHPAFEAVLELHSKKNQNYRTRVLQGFLRENWKLGCIMFASDVGSRGIDTTNVDCVIQLGMPGSRQQYVQRVGRAARAQSQTGISLTLINPFEAKTFTKMCAGLPISTPHVDSLGLGLKPDFFNNTKLYVDDAEDQDGSKTAVSTSQHDNAKSATTKFGYTMTSADDFSSMDEFDDDMYQQLETKRAMDNYKRKVKLAIQYGNDIPPIPAGLIQHLSEDEIEQLLADQAQQQGDGQFSANEHSDGIGGKPHTHADLSTKSLKETMDSMRTTDMAQTEDERSGHSSEQEVFDYNTLFEGKYKFVDTLSSGEEPSLLADSPDGTSRRASNGELSDIGSSLEDPEPDEQGLWDGVIERACAGLYIERLPATSRPDRYKNLFKMSMSSYTAATTVNRHETMEWLIKKQIGAVARDNELGLNAERAYVAYLGHHIALFNQSSSVQAKLIHAVKVYKSPYQQKQDICKIALDFAQGVGLCGPTKNKPPPAISEKVAARLGLKPNPYIVIGIPKIYPQSEFQDDYASGSGSVQYTDDSSINRKKRPPNTKKKKSKKEPMPGRHLLQKYSLQQTRPRRLRTGELDYRHHEDIIL